MNLLWTMCQQLLSKKRHSLSSTLFVVDIICRRHYLLSTLFVDNKWVAIGNHHRPDLPVQFLAIRCRQQTFWLMWIRDLIWFLLLFGAFITLLTLVR